MILSEYDSKALLRSYGVPTVDEALARDPAEASRRARELGFPVAIKLCATGLAHKTERDLVRLGIADDEGARAAAEELWSRREAGDRDASLLVQRMVRGRRELILGLVRDRQFGPCVMLGLGGILAEAVRDVVFRAAPLTPVDALEMIGDLKTAHLLGPFRGEPAVDRDAVAAALVAVGRIGVERPDVASIDVNPMIMAGATPVAVDALVERSEP
jgi:acetate---CoA ligase (ADP-forming) subunit beta